GFQPAELLAPPIIRHLTHPDLADCIHHVLALRDQNIDLPQLRNDLFRLVSLPCHCSPPGCQRHTSSRTTSMGVDQYRMRKQYEVLCIRAGYSNTARISFIATDDQCGSIHLGLHCAVAPCWRELCKFARDKTGNVPLWSRLVPYLGGTKTVESL